MSMFLLSYSPERARAGRITFIGIWIWCPTLVYACSFGRNGKQTVESVILWFHTRGVESGAQIDLDKSYNRHYVRI